MVRAPCCEKVGLKKGPWSIEEDQILVDYIQRHGHENWRALPKQSGLLRCGKSCRLRWTNYLRPDIKRGNFTKEEEDAIISLHGKLGNRWSAIAANLPGRTDNEIKNVWHTHLKKRVHPKEETQVSKKKKKHDAKTKLVSEVVTLQPDADLDVPRYDNSSFMSASVERSCSDFSSFVTDSCVMSGDATNDVGAEEESFSSEKLERIDESFWLEALSIETSAESMNLTSLEVPPAAAVGETFGLFSSIASDDMEFWLQIFKEAECLENLTQMNPTD